MIVAGVIYWVLSATSIPKETQMSSAEIKVPLS